MFIHNNKRKGGVLLWLDSEVQTGKISSLRYSLSGTGKELEKRPYAPGQHGPNQRKNYQNMVYNYVKNKNYVTYME